MNELARQYPDSLAGRGGSRAAPPVEELGYYYADHGEETHLRHYWKILLKRIRPMAMGARAIFKRKTCHVTIKVTDQPIKKKK